ncbi:amidohydrolase family protein [Sphingomonas oligophenolica]
MAALTAAAFLVVPGSGAQAKDIIVHAGRLLDGTLRPVRSNISIVIKDDRIVSITDGFVDAAGAEIIDLSHQTVMPGFIEAHDHLVLTNDRDDEKPRMMSSGEAYVRLVRNAYAEIANGFTSTRDCGSHMVDMKVIKYSIAKGRLIGPRIWAALEPLGPVGGHSDPWNQEGGDTVSADEREHALVHGADDARDKVREHFMRGANLIKIMPSGGVSSLNDDPNALTMTYEEIKAVVDAAHALGLKVAAHAIGLEAIKASVRAGVDSIEHGIFVDADTLREMKAQGTFFDPTVLTAYVKLEAVRANPSVYDPRVVAKGLKAWPLQIAVAETAHKMGVKIVMGTDQSSLGAGANKADGIIRLVQAGLTPQEAIVAATGTNADLIGSKDIGVIEAGRYADIIAIDGDPLVRIEAVRNVQFVMKGGKVFKDHGQMAALP